MRFDRFFHTLVVSGAALVSGCDREDVVDDAHDDTTSTPGVADPSATSMSAGTVDAATGDGGASSPGGSTGGGTEGGTGASTGGASAESDEGGPQATTEVDPAPPEGCSEPPSPFDPCGCPCCWALDCPNDDESCCEGFLEFCTPA